MEDLVGAIIQLLVAFLLFLLPLGLIARKAGRSPWLAALALIPIVGVLIALSMIAKGQWPTEEGR